MTELPHSGSNQYTGIERHDVVLPAIVVRDLRVSFAGAQNREVVPVLEGIRFEIQRGEFVCFVGPSGCGKTTLLNVLGGFQQATHGEVLIDGKRIQGQDPKRIFIFQEGGVFPWLTVRDNVAFGLARKSRADRTRIVHHYLDMVGLTGFEAAYPHELSGA